MDEIKPTPRNKLLGLLANGLRGGLDFATNEGKNKPMNMLADLLGVPAVASVADKLSYGEDLTTGKGFATRLKPDVFDAAVSVAPFVSPTLKMAGLLREGAGMLKGGQAMQSMSKASPMADRGAIGNFSGNVYYETPEVHQKKISDLYRAFGNFGNSQSGMSPQTARSLYEKGLLKASKKETDLLLDMTDASGAIRPQIAEPAAGGERLLKILERNGQTLP